MANWALYGATGYTGPLIAERAVERGHRPILMGRSEEKLKPLAARLGLEHRAVSLDDAAKLRAALEGLDLVLHAAGPFIHTSPPMVQACLDARVSYLDLTGEPEVFHALYSLDAEARSRGVLLMPGVGFDIVPTDGLIAHVAQKVRAPRTLEFALAGIATPSAGTVKSAVPVVLGGGRVYRNGHPVSWPLGRGAKRIRLSSGECWGMPAPICDLDAAYRSTGIPDITAYYAVSKGFATLGRIGWPLGAALLPLARLAFGNGRLDGLIEKRVQGGDAETRAAGKSFLWAKVEGQGGTAEAWLECAEGYAFTADSAVHAVEKTLSKRPRGALTPSQAFGVELLTGLPGVTLGDRLPLSTVGRTRG